MAFKILTNQRISALIEKLAPRFLGRDQDHLVAFADEIADVAYDTTVDYVEPLFDFRDDIQSPAGAAMVGILDAGGVYTGGSVEAALQEVPGLISAGTSGLVIDSIADADTTHAPSRNAVFDALAGKQAASANLTAWSALATSAKQDASANLTSWSAIAPSAKADLASPTFTGDPKAPTPLTSDNDTSIATTAFVKAQGYTSNTGTVTSVGITPGTGLSVTGSPITTSGSFNLTLSANLQSWSGIAPASKADDSAVVHIAGAETISGAKTFSATSTAYSNKIVFTGGAVAAYNDFSKHIDLFSAVYGFTITAGTLNIVSNASTNFYNAGSNYVTISNTGLFTYGGLEVGYRDIPRTTSALTRGQMFATSAGVTVNTGAAAGSTYSVYNDSAAAITLTQGAGLTMRLAGTATTGSRTLAARGFATIWFNSTTECIVNGNVT